MTRTAHRTHVALGLTLVVAAVVANEVVLQALLSPDGVLEGPSRGLIRAGQLAVAALGVAWMASARLRRILVFGAVAVLLPLSVVEALLWTWDPLGQRYLVDIARLVDLHEPDPDCGYRLPPGLTVELQGVEIRSNAAGMRWRDMPSRAGRDGVQRVLVLGDSLVFGWGVAQEAILAAALEEALAGGPAPVEVDSAGQISWNSRLEVEYLRSLEEEQAPDLVALVITPNDAVPRLQGHHALPAAELAPLVRRPPPERSPELLHRLLVVHNRSYQAVARRGTTRRQAEFHARSYEPRSAAWRETEMAVADLEQLAQRRGITVVPFLYANPETLLAPLAEEAYRELLGRHGLPLHLFPAALYDRQRRNSATDCHPDAEGHRIMAGTVGEILRSLLTTSPRWAPASHPATGGADRTAPIASPAAVGDDIHSPPR